MQPDSIIPDQSNPQSWNRFSYVRSNPVNFNDPTGHRACGDGEEYDCDGTSNNPSTPSPSNGCGGAGQPSCGGGGGGGGGGSGSKDPNIQRQDELFSWMFQGSGENGSWTSDDWVAYYANRDDFWNDPTLWLNPDDVAGWELFVLHVERLASHYSANQREQFVRDFGLVFAGLSATAPWHQTSLNAVDGSGEYNYLHEGNAGLDKMFLDDLDEFDSVSKHYAGFFFLGFFAGEGPAILGNLARDGDFWNGEYNQGDINTGNVAAGDGAYFFRSWDENLSPADVAGWIDELSP